MAGEMDPKILMLENRISAFETVIKNNTASNLTQGLEELVRKLPQLQNDYINAVGSMNDKNGELQQSLIDIAENFPKRIEAVKSALVSQKGAMEKATADIAKMTKMSEDQLHEFEQRVARTSKATGDELIREQVELKVFLSTVYAENSKNFDQFKTQHTAAIKEMIKSDAEAGKSIADYGEKTKAAIKAIVPELESETLTADQLKKVLKEFNATQEIATENAPKLAESFEQTAISTANAAAQISVLDQEIKKLTESFGYLKKNADVQAAGFNDMGAAFSKYADSIAKEQKTLFGGLIKSTLDFRKESHGAGDLFNSLKGGMAKAAESLFSYDKMIDRVFGFMHQRMIMPTFEFAKAIAQVNKETGGFGKEFESSSMTGFMGMQASNVGALGMYGVSLEKYGKAYGDLANKIGGFNDMSDKQRKILAANAAALETLGISTDTYAKLTTGFMGALQKNTLATRDAIEGLAKDAISLGKNVGQYTREFEQFMPKLIGYGREASTIFKEVSAFAQATKGAVQASDIMALSEKFQTFESAAESVSKLNAMLGGVSVNILDVMGKDPAQIAMTVKRAANEANLEFDKLNIGYKRMLSEAFGGDMQKAAAFYKMDLAEAQEYMDRSAATEKELEERKRASVAAQEKLNALLDNFKIGLTPILDMMNGISSVFTWLSQNGKVLIGGVLLGMTGLIAGAVFMWNKFKNAAIMAAEQIVVAMRTAVMGTRMQETEVKKLIEHYRELSRTAGLASTEINKTNIAGKGGSFSGFGKAMGVAAIGITALSLLGAVGKGVSNNIAEGPQDHSEAGIIGPNGKITPNAGNNFIYRNGNVTTFNSRDMVGTAKEGEQVFLQPSVSNMTNTSNTISNGPSSRTDWVTQLMSPELPIVKSTKELSASLISTNKESAKSVEVAKESLKLEYATKELRESANLRKESEVQRQREVFESAFTSEKVTAQLTKQPAINNYFKVGRKEMKLFTEEASGEMTEAVASNFVSRGIVKG